MGVMIIFSILEMGVESFVKQLLKQSAGINKKEKHGQIDRSLPMVAIYGNLTLASTKSINVPTPSYVQILTRGILSITSFSLLRKGSIMQYDLKDLTRTRTINGNFLWPNELTMFQDKNNKPILLVPDGFLLPGQNDGGLYAIRDPHTINAQPVRITKVKKGWFYHRAVHVKLPTGQEGILTARARKPLFGRGLGELVWLSLPSNLDSCFTESSGIDEFSTMKTKTRQSRVRHSTMNQAAIDKCLGWKNGLKDKDSVHHTTMNQQAIDRILSKPTPPHSSPWVETILAEGPDVMFEVLDLDSSDECLEVVSAHFFGEKLSVHSIRAIPEAPFIETSVMKTLDTIGRPYGLCLATMEPTRSKLKDEENSGYKSDFSSCDNSAPTHLLVSTHECSYDFPAAYNMVLSSIGGIYPTIISGAALAFRNGKQSVRPVHGIYDSDSEVRGGSLFAYEIPRVDSTSKIKKGVKTPSESPKIEKINEFTPSSSLQENTEIKETTESLNWKRHTLFRGFKVSGWGGIISPGAPGFPYVFRMPNKPQAPPLILLAGDCTGSAYVFAPRLEDTNIEEVIDITIPNYELAFEIQCGATVGSAAVGTIPDGTGDVEIFVPSYEANKVHIFRLTDNDDIAD